MKEFKKAAIEKKARQIEERVKSGSTTDNRSAIRAIARLRAAKDLCKPADDAEQKELREKLVETFYKDAKYQPAWTDALKKEDADFQTLLEGNLGTPAPRAKKADNSGPPAAGTTPSAPTNGSPDGSADPEDGVATADSSDTSPVTDPTLDAVVGDVDATTPEVTEDPVVEVLAAS